jgi:type I restriction enzyme S subunit
MTISPDVDLLDRPERDSLPSNWKTEPLRELCYKPEYGYTESAVLEPVGPRFLRITDIQNGRVDWNTVPYCPCSDTDAKKYRLAKGDLLVARIGATTGKTFYIEDCPPAVFASYLIRLRPRAIDGQFLYYFCQSDLYWSQINAGKGEKLKGGVSGGTLSEIEVNVPPPPEQSQIASLLRKMERLVGLQEDLVDRLCDLKTVVTAKLLGEGLRRERLKDSEFGPIPESWDVITLRERCQLRSGGTPSRSIPEYWNGDVPWVKTTEIDYRDIMTTEEKITQAGLQNSSAKIFDEGTLLMAMYGQGVTRGRVAILGLPAATNQACAAFFPDETLSSRYLYAYFTYAYDHIRQIGHGANQQNLSLELLQGIKIPVPKTVTEQEEIFSVISKVQKRIEAAERKRDTLRDLFRATLGTLMSGKVRVSGLDTPAEVANA